MTPPAPEAPSEAMGNLESAPPGHGATMIDGEWVDGERADAPAPPAPSAPEPVETFSPFGTYDLVVDTSVAELCARVSHEAAGRAPQMRCRDLGAFPLRPSPQVRGLRRVEVTEPGYRYQQLVAVVPGGVVALPIQWSMQDHPRDPGCPSIVRLRGLEQARMEGDHLLVMGIGETTTYDPDGSPLDELLRQPFVVRFDTMRAAEYSPWTGVNVGRKTLPRGVRGLGRGLPWRDRRAVTITAEGQLRLASR